MKPWNSTAISYIHSWLALDSEIEINKLKTININ